MSRRVLKLQRKPESQARGQGIRVSRPPRVDDVLKVGLDEEAAEDCRNTNHDKAQAPLCEPPPRFFGLSNRVQAYRASLPIEVDRGIPHGPRRQETPRLPARTGKMLDRCGARAITIEDFTRNGEPLHAGTL